MKIALPEKFNASAFLVSLLERSKSGIGRNILDMNSGWRSYTFVEIPEQLKHIESIDAGGVMSRNSSIEELLDLLSYKQNTNLIIWEDPYMSILDAQLPQSHSVKLFEIGDCLYLSKLIKGLTVDAFEKANYYMISFDKLMFISDSKEAPCSQNRKNFAHTVSMIVISAFDEEGFIVFERE